MNSLHTRIYLFLYLFTGRRPYPELWNIINHDGIPRFMDAALLVIERDIAKTIRRRAITEALQRIGIEKMPPGLLPPFNPEEYALVCNEIELAVLLIHEGRLRDVDAIRYYAQAAPWVHIVRDVVGEWKKAYDTSPPSLEFDTYLSLATQANLVRRSGKNTAE